MSIADMLAEAEARMLDEHPVLKQRIAALEAENRELQIVLRHICHVYRFVDDEWEAAQQMNALAADALAEQRERAQERRRSAVS